MGDTRNVGGANNVQPRLSDVQISCAAKQNVCRNCANPTARAGCTQTQSVRRGPAAYGHARAPVSAHLGSGRSLFAERLVRQSRVEGDLHHDAAARTEARVSATRGVLFGDAAAG